MTIRRSPSKAKSFGFDAALAGASDLARDLVGNGAGERALEEVLITNLRPDPENPRRLEMTREKLLADLQTLGEVDAERVAQIRGLAATILDEGLRQPIESYPFGEGGLYRIVSGERRYWACLYNYLSAPADQRVRREMVNSFVYRQAPTILRRFQLTENLQREDLTVAELYRSVVGAWKESDEQNPGQQIGSAHDLQATLSLPKNQAYAIYAVRKKWPALEKQILEGRLPSMRAVRLVLDQTDDIIKRLLPKIAQHGFTADMVQEVIASDAEKQAAAPASTKSRGRPTTYAAVARFKPLQIERLWQIVIAARPDLGLQADIDWASPASGKQAIEVLLKALDAAT